MLAPLLYTYEQQVNNTLQQVYRYTNASESYQFLSGEMPVYQNIQENTENENRMHIYSSLKVQD